MKRTTAPIIDPTHYAEAMTSRGYRLVVDESKRTACWHRETDGRRLMVHDYARALEILKTGLGGHDECHTAS